jgi:hypothetical protein
MLTHADGLSLALATGADGRGQQKKRKEKKTGKKHLFYQFKKKHQRRLQVLNRALKSLKSALAGP